MLNLAEKKQISYDKLSMFRENAHRIADNWVDSLADALLGDKPMTMEEISALFNEKKGSFMGALVEEFIGAHHQEVLAQDIAPCPWCGKFCKAKRYHSRRVETRQGSSLLERPYFLCTGCGKGFSPLDQALELSGRRKQYDLQRLVLDFIAETPYKRSAELFAKATGISFSEDTIHDLVAEFTEELTIEETIPSAEEINRRIDSVKGTNKRRPVLVVAADGAHVPTRPTPGKKQKRGP
jgi:hypothetical protein